MNKHRYILGSNRVKKLNCPYCGAKKHWQRYIDIITGEILPEQFGRCDNEGKCSEWNNPYKMGYVKLIKKKDPCSYSEFSNNWKPQRKTQCRILTPKPEPVFIPEEILKQTLKPEGYEKNLFIQNLLSRVPFPFEAKDIEKVISQYYLGTVCKGFRYGAITFPFIDKRGHVRTIQVKQFDETNHTTGTDFLHSILEKDYQQRRESLPVWLEEYRKNELKVTCLFGEHLLRKYPFNPIALVEAPKTTIYGTLYFGFPEQIENFLWLAVYNLSSLNFEKCKALQGRDVCLFPDLSEGSKAFDLWSRKAKDIADQMPTTHFEVSDLLETIASNELRMSGADIADIVIQFDWREFRSQNKQKNQFLEPEENVKGEISEAAKTNSSSQRQESPLVEKCQSVIETPKASWPIDELEKFFTSANHSTLPIKLDTCNTIIDMRKFVDSHLAIIKAQNGNSRYLPYLDRLILLKNKLTININ